MLSVPPIFLAFLMSLGAGVSPADATRDGTAGRVLSLPVGLMVSGWDDDGDHLITEAEWSTGTSREWRMALPGDAEALSALSFQDWAERAMGTRHPMPGFQAYDADFNGSITAEEFAAQMDAMKTRLDRDNDGQITRSELVFELPARRMQQGEGRTMRERRGQSRQRGGGRPF